VGEGERERERLCKLGEEKPYSPAFTRLGEEKGVQCYQNYTVCFFFFVMNNE
jgi:hypothetical protein